MRDARATVAGEPWSLPLLPRLLAADDRVALRVGDAARTYRDLAAYAAAHLHGLERRGIGPGDRVAVWTQPTPETAAALAAHALAGVISVPLNPKLGEGELAHILRDAAPHLTVAADPSGLPAPAEALPGRDAALARTRLEPFASRAAVDDPVLVLYTSGTTGPPKGAVITAGNVAANLDALAEIWDWTEADTVTHALPLFHVHGLVLGLFGSLRRGGGLAWVPRFSPAPLAESLATDGTMLFAVPTMWRRLADAADTDPAVARALSGARVLISGSAGLPLRTHERVKRITGRFILERYGLTETLINCGVPLDATPVPGTVGPPLPGVAARLVDDARKPLDAHDDGTVGEIAVRGPSVFAGYLHQESATAAVRDADGWFRTGDLATRTREGWFRILGRRATDLIKTGGYRVGAGEVEACLLEWHDVAEAAVLGVPDDDLGERIVAFVVPEAPGDPPDPTKLTQHVADRLTPHKRPREVRIVPSLPRNAMGKVQKAILRRWVSP